MILEVKKQEKESTRRLFQRFSRVSRKTGILKRAREIQFYQRPLSKTKKKRAALRRIAMKKKYQDLRK